MEQKPIDWSQRKLNVGPPKIQTFCIWGALGGQKLEIFGLFLKGCCARIYGQIFTGQKNIRFGLNWAITCLMEKSKIKNHRRIQG